MSKHNDMASFEARGFACVADCFRQDELDKYLAEANRGLEQGSTSVKSREAIFGARNLLDVVPSTRSLIDNPAITSIVVTILGRNARLVRALWFDKPPRANWSVPWHQDQFIAAREKMAHPDYTSWTIKSGVPHARAPRSLLERMLLVRIHLDPCGDDAGPLRVAIGSHRQGILSNAEIAEMVGSAELATCCVPAGGILIMRPLLLHASSPSARSDHRRVVPIEFAGCDLPPPLRWHLDEPIARIEPAESSPPARPIDPSSL